MRLKELARMMMGGAVVYALAPACSPNASVGDIGALDSRDSGTERPAPATGLTIDANDAALDSDVSDVSTETASDGSSDDGESSVGANAGEMPAAIDGGEMVTGASDARDGDDIVDAAVEADGPGSQFPPGDPCFPGTVRCNLLQTQTCTDGRWTDGELCDCLCVAGTCSEC